MLSCNQSLNYYYMGKYLTLLSTVLVLVSNFLANLLPINGKSTKELSDAIPVFFTPAGYVFAIWGVIYLGLIAYTYFRFRYANQIKSWHNIDAAYFLSGIANSLWIVIWHYEQVVFSVFVMLVLLISLVYLYLKLLPSLANKESTHNIWLVKLPFGIYLGWICVATIANISAALFILNWDGFGITGIVWSAIMIVVAMVLTLLMLWRKRDLAFALVYIWATIGIAYKFNFIPAINLTAAFAVVAVSLFAAALYRHRLLKIITFK